MIFLVFALCILVADLFIKKQIEKRDESAFPVPLPGGFILEKHHNQGFMLNRLDRHPMLVRIISCLVFFPFLGWFLWLLAKKDGNPEKWGAAFLVGGSASNLCDRLFRGYVIDYLRIPIKKIRNVIFNIADFFIFLGGAWTAVCTFLAKQRP